MFVAKKILTAFLYPVPLCLGLLLAGLLLLWFTRRQRTGKILVTLGFALCTLLGYGSISARIVRPLESAHPPLLDIEKAHSVKWIVVLGGGHGSNTTLQANARLNSETLGRLVEGIRLHRELPGTRLLVSGGAWLGTKPDSEVMAEAARSLGVEEGNLVLESVSQDTEDEAVELGKTLGTDPFILVTSAVHMPRAMYLFREMGMNPIPAPTDFLVKDADSRIKRPSSYLPSSENLCAVRQAEHEYLGMIWLHIKAAVGLFPHPSVSMGTRTETLDAR